MMNMSIKGASAYIQQVSMKMQSSVHTVQNDKGQKIEMKMDTLEISSRGQFMGMMIGRMRKMDPEGMMDRFESFKEKMGELNLQEMDLESMDSEGMKALLGQISESFGNFMPRFSEHALNLEKMSEDEMRAALEGFQFRADRMEFRMERVMNRIEMGPMGPPRGFPGRGVGVRFMMAQMSTIESPESAEEEEGTTLERMIRSLVEELEMSAVEGEESQAKDLIETLLNYLESIQEKPVEEPKEPETEVPAIEVETPVPEVPVEVEAATEPAEAPVEASAPEVEGAVEI